MHLAAHTNEECYIFGSICLLCATLRRKDRVAETAFSLAKRDFHQLKFIRSLWYLNFARTICRIFEVSVSCHG